MILLLRAKKGKAMSKRVELLPCKCGKTPKLRYRMPYSWVQCKCGRQSARFVDGYEQVDPEAVRAAIADWNEKYGVKVE